LNPATDLDVAVVQLEGDLVPSSRAVAHDQPLRRESGQVPLTTTGTGQP